MTCSVMGDGVRRWPRCQAHCCGVSARYFARRASLLPHARYRSIGEDSHLFFWIGIFALTSYVRICMHDDYIIAFLSIVHLASKAWVERRYVSFAGTFNCRLRTVRVRTSRLRNFKNQTFNIDCEEDNIIPRYPIKGSASFLRNKL